jgi:two-component system, NtrC family, C4-dicarboxylate transport sensor histidine kinase DctB
MPETALRPQRKTHFVFILAIVISGLACWAVWHVTLRANLAETARRGDNVLQLAVSSLSGQLERYANLPALIADQTIVRDLAATPDNAALARSVNLYLAKIQRQLGAADVYLMDQDGLTIAASNYGQTPTFIGRNFAFRPYFYQALTGQTGRYYALGTTSGKRGYYFGAPVYDGGRITGVLVFKIDLDAIENDWRGVDYAVIVTDPDGVVFLSSRSDWLFSALRPLTDAARAQIAATQRYASKPIALLGAVPIAASPPDLLRLQLGGREYVQRSNDMPSAGWQVQVLIDTQAARTGAAMAGIVALLSGGLVLAMGLLLAQQRARLAERLHLQASAQADLERRVQERTDELKQAQSDLLQAGKLAALGQMSAALSHEFNQPLTAARTYADNAAVLLDRGRTADARENIARILALIDRLASISKHLSNFARKPKQSIGPVSLPEVIDAALEIAALRLKTAKAALSVDVPSGLPLVLAGPVRLQQVLVNILSNAADATEGRADARVHLAVRCDGDFVVICVRDNGAGVPAALVPRIFDPFFSTKGVGKGLGLGLSISYNIVKDFGGSLEVAAPDDGGAEFTISLRRARDFDSAYMAPKEPSLS